MEIDNYLGAYSSLEKVKKTFKKTFRSRPAISGTYHGNVEKSWADDFYRLIFSQINEERFSVLYSDKASRPNKPVNVLVSLLILKQENLLSDEELIGSLYFDYRFQYTLGLETNSDKDRLCINTLSNFRRCACLLHFRNECIPNGETFTRLPQFDTSKVKMFSFYSELSGLLRNTE